METKELEEKAKNFFILGLIGENLGMLTEATANYFKALFAVDDLELFKKINREPKDHADRFELLKKYIPPLYSITDRLFNTYRKTYMKKITLQELLLVKQRVMEAFKNAKITFPTTEEIRKKFEELLKKGKFFS